jgi:hypothetical protein
MNILNHPMHALRGMPYLIASMVFVGALLGGAVVPAVQGVLESFDQANPVVVAQARVLSSTADEVVVMLSGRKERDCQYIGLQAYTRRPGDETLTDAYIRRIDLPETGATRPRGEFSSFGTWKIWPRGSAGTLLIYVQYSCSGRLVVGKMAEVDIPIVR